MGMEQMRLARGADARRGRGGNWPCGDRRRLPVCKSHCKPNSDDKFLAYADRSCKIYALRLTSRRFRRSIRFRLAVPLITINHTQECLSMAFVHALTGSAGVNVRLLERRHDYGVDGSLYNVKIGGSRHVDDGYPVDFQMKSSTNWSLDEDHVVYDLESKTYNDIVNRNADPIAVSLILILLCLPKAQSEWLEGSETALTLRNCCYWVKFSGEPTQNIATQRIRVPRKNVLNREEIHEILRREREGWPK